MSVFNFKNNENLKKRAIFRYFEAIYRNFSKIVLLNLAYFACMIPLFCGMVSAICLLLGVSAETIESIYFVHISVWFASLIPFPVFAVLFVASLLAYGPLTAGLTHCVMNLVQGRYVFVSDMFVQAKKNIKQGIFFGIVDILVILSVVLYMSSNPAAIEGGISYFYRIGKIASIIIAVIYFCMRFYTYSIAVKFELPIKDIFKNSYLFCVLGFFRNILAYIVVFIVLMSCVSTPRVDIVLIGTLFFAVSRFSVLFATFPIIDEYMLKKVENNENNTDK